jgi:hypothetical protein
MPDRRTERNELIYQLVERGKSVLMLAPRRIGKTWTMRRIEEDADSEPFDAVFYDAEAAKSEDEFYRQLNRAIEKRLGFTTMARAVATERFKGIFSGNHEQGKLAQILGKLPPKQLLEAVVEQLNARKDPTMIMVDEIAIFVLRLYRDRPERVEVFLSELRDIRQRFPNVRWLLTGSIGLDWVARKAEVAGALNDLKPYSFTPFSTAAARKFIERFVRDGGTRRPFFLEKGTFDYLVAELGWLSPFYLEAIAGEIRGSGEADKEGRNIANKNDVENAFRTLLESQNRNYFSSWCEHLSKNFETPMKERLHILLDVCARSADGAVIDTLLSAAAKNDPTVTRGDIRDALDILNHDGYLTENEATGRFKFTSGLMRRWWLRWMCNDDIKSAGE